MWADWQGKEKHEGKNFFLYIHKLGRKYIVKWNLIYNYSINLRLNMWFVGTCNSKNSPIFGGCCWKSFEFINTLLLDKIIQQQRNSFQLGCGWLMYEAAEINEKKNQSNVAYATGIKKKSRRKHQQTYYMMLSTSWITSKWNIMRYLQSIYWNDNNDDLEMVQF